MAMNEESYRLELRNHFMGQMKNSKLRTQYYKDQTQKMHDQEDNSFNPQARTNLAPQLNGSGGDAERALFESNYGGGGSYRRANDSNFMQQLHAKANKDPAMPSHSAPHKCESPNFDIYETASNLGGAGPGSEKSSKSQKSSSRTVVSKKSSHDLRKMVRSQCKLHDVIDDTLKQISTSYGDPMSEDNAQHINGQAQMTATRHCKHCIEKVKERSSHRDVTTEISKGDFLESHSGDTLTISLDDVVNSKVINPMMRRLQRMCLNNLREEVSFLEDLEHLPHKVNEVYKATIFKQKD